MGLLSTDYCPKCDAKTQRDSITSMIKDVTNSKYFQIMKCHLCNKIFCYIYNENSEKEPSGDFLFSSLLHYELDSVFPKQSKVQTTYLKNKIKEPYLEGVNCLDNFCPNASVMMFRRTLSIICIDLGADNEKNLEDQMDSLPQELGLTATEIQKWGNLGAHLDKKGKVESVKTEDAQEIKVFLEKVFLVVYELPERLKQSANKRN